MNQKGLDLSFFFFFFESLVLIRFDVVISTV